VRRPVAYIRGNSAPILDAAAAFSVKAGVEGRGCFERWPCYMVGEMEP
jgi:hypothetical protein